MVSIRASGLPRIWRGAVRAVPGPCREGVGHRAGEGTKIGYNKRVGSPPTRSSWTLSSAWHPAP